MVNPLFLFLQYRVSMIFLLGFQLIFLPLRHKKMASGCIAAGCFLLTGVLDYIEFFINYNSESMLTVTVVQIILVQATAYMLCCYRDFRALFTGISSATYVLPGNIISTVAVIYMKNNLTALFVQVFCHVIIMIPLLMMRWNYLKEMENPLGSWGKLCMIPTLFYLVMYTLACWPSNLYERRENWLAAYLFLLLMGFTYILIIKLISQEHIDRELERSNEFFETYASGLRREADILRNSEEKIKVLRHDSRHFYQMIGIYLEKGEIKKIKELLDQMDTELQSLASKRFCDNITINGILSAFEEKAKKETIVFMCEADVPKELKTANEFELATVIANLLENALYAASKVEKKEEKKVKIRIFPVKEQLVLEIMNTFDGKCKISNVTGLPLSERGEEHGYGMRSVKAYANKHHAIFRYSIEDGLFCVRLLANV